MQAIHMAAANIEVGMGEAFLCVGVESMTMVPQGGPQPFPNPQLKAGTHAYMPMGLTAENVAERWNVSRYEQEAFAVESHRKAAAAREQGRLRDEIVAIRTPEGELVTEDGCIRPGTSLEALANLEARVPPRWRGYRRTSSPLTDGAVVVLVTSDTFAARHNLPVSARILSFAVAGVDPEVMGVGPIPATLKALVRASLNVKKLGVRWKSTRHSPPKPLPACAIWNWTRPAPTSTAAASRSAIRWAPPERASPPRAAALLQRENQRVCAGQRSALAAARVSPRFSKASDVVSTVDIAIVPASRLNLSRSHP